MYVKESAPSKNEIFYFSAPAQRNQMRHTKLRLGATCKKRGREGEREREGEGNKREKERDRQGNCPGELHIVL